MTNTKWYARFAGAGALAAALAFAPLPLPAQPGGGHRHGMGFGGGPAFNVERMATVLELTPAQQQQIKALQQREMDATKPLREQMRTNHQQLAEAMKAGNTSQVETLSQQEGVLMGKLRVAGLTAHNELKSILTPEQQTKLENLRPMRGSRSRTERAPAGARRQQQ